ncbi:MAG: GNAT family N-acetyltransferase [Bdellovibrionaceae bacterium]|nr:GNAT family N-acetyltransferase [Pseudobdellovibrionaceae bacterium]
MKSINDNDNNRFLYSSDSALMQVDKIHHFLSRDSYWSPEIPKDFVERAIKHSLCFGVFDKHIDPILQVGFIRVVTDYATFAWICDVYIDKDYRNLGLSKKLMSEVMNHPGLQSLRRICLATVGAHKLYEKFGFQVTQTPGAWMEIKDNDIYKKMNR